MRWLLGLLVVVLGLLGLAEVLVAPALEEVVARRIGSAGLGQRDVDVELSGFPVVARVVATGKVQRAVVTLAEVRSQGLTFATVRADVTGTSIERSALLDGEVSFESVDRVVLSGEVTAAELTRLLPVGVTDLVLVPGSATVDLFGEQVAAQVSASEGVLRVVPQGAAPMDVALPSGELFPCVLAGEVGEGVVHVSCRLDDVPSWLLARVGTDLDG